MTVLNRHTTEESVGKSKELKRETSVVYDTIPRFTEEVVSVAQRITGDGDESAAPEGDGFVDHALVSLHCLRVYTSVFARIQRC